MKRIASSLVLALAVVLLIGQAAPVRAGGAKAVEIDNFKFHPPTLEVAKGTKVVFSNSSGTAHTATDKGVFDSGRIKPGHSFAVRFERKGTFRYHCEIHPFMHGKIVVG